MTLVGRKLEEGHEIKTEREKTKGERERERENMIEWRGGGAVQKSAAEAERRG